MPVEALTLGADLEHAGGESISVAQSALIERWFSKKELGLALGASLSISRLGSVINNALSPAIASATYNVRPANNGCTRCCALSVSTTRPQHAHALPTLRQAMHTRREHDHEAMRARRTHATHALTVESAPPHQRLCTSASSPVRPRRRVLAGVPSSAIHRSLRLCGLEWCFVASRGSRASTCPASTRASTHGYE